MLDVLPPRTVRLAAPEDLPALEATFPEGPRTKHAARFDRQERGDGYYLVVTQTTRNGEVFCGHAFLKWKGADNGPAQGVLTDCPEIEDLFVHEGHRRRKVATRLLDFAERLTAERGYKQIGLGCATDNPTASRLYEARGYRDAGLGIYQNIWDYVDTEGVEQTCIEECTYLIRSLGSATGKAPSVSDTPETDETGEVTMAQETAKNEPENKDRSVTDKVVDFTFGVAVLAAETVEKTVKALGEKAKEFKGEAPSLFDAVQEKGRPARERLVKSVKEDSLNPFVAVKGSLSSAESEIQVLEERVKALEAQVGPTAYAPVTEAEPTAAESATVVVDFTPESPTPESLADSSYAITDQEEESAALAQLQAEEAQADLPVEVPTFIAETSAIDVEVPVEVSTEVPVEVTEETSSEPEKPKRNRRKKAEETEAEGESV